MINISICICTRNRQEGLKKILDSLESIQTPSQSNIKIVIIENDKENYSEDIVKKYSSKSKFDIYYYLENRQGLAFARNRSVKEAGECDFCCFVDDDQIVASDWLVALIKCQDEFNADGVYGCCLPYFNKDVPLYIKNFHEREKFEYGTIIKTAATGGLLLRKKYLDMIDGPFDIRFNFTGGEDSYLTSMIANIGGVIRYTPNAIAYEIIPKSRTTIKYIIKKTYRISNTRLFVNSLLDKKKSGWNAFPRLVMRFCLGLFILFPFLLFGKSKKLIGLEKIVATLGGFLFILGIKNKYYK